MPTLHRLAILPLLPLLLAFAGCSAYVSGYHYMPQPAVIQVPATQPNNAPPMTVLASVIGVRRADADRHRPEAVEVRLRFENGVSQPAAFDPRSLELITGNLVTFPPPTVTPPDPAEIAPGQQLPVVAFFPFPPGLSNHTLDMSTLRLRWRATVGGRPVEGSMNFQQLLYVEPYYSPYYYPYAPFYDPWWGPGPWYGGPYHHRHWR